MSCLELQRMQNKMMRLVSGTSIQDRISIRNLLEMTNNISVNQMNAQIKIQEIWKALNINHYPLTVTNMVKLIQRFQQDHAQMENLWNLVNV